MNYYQNNTHMQTLVDMLTKETGVSLRIIDFLCTNYAKKYDVVYYIGQSKTPFNLYLQYRSQLKAYSKMQFDPFRRHNRIVINVPSSMIPSGKLETTVAQLNFFKWAIDCKVLHYINNKNIAAAVEQHMNAKAQKKPHPKPMASTKTHHIQVTVTFK